MIGTFDKETQTSFYKNLCDAMAKYDNMQSKFDFHVSPHLTLTPE